MRERRKEETNAVEDHLQTQDSVWRDGSVCVPGHPVALYLVPPSCSLTSLSDFEW